MKKSIQCALTMSVAMLIANVASAKSLCDLSFDEIYQKGYQTQMPKVEFPNFYTSIDSLCSDGSNLKTKEPVEICTAWGQGELGCTESKLEKFSTPIKYKKKFSTGVNTVFVGSSVIVEMEHKLVQKIPVGLDGEAFSVVCYKDYKIEQCQ